MLASPSPLPSASWQRFLIWFPICTIIGVIPAILLGFSVSPIKALLAIVVFVVANQLEGNVLESFMILSRSTGLHPVTVLLAILVGASLFGLVGALLAVPFVALGKILIEDYVLKRPAYTGEKHPPY
ncbi:MAG: AI-2E family transporter [Deinococcales bacterium]